MKFFRKGLKTELWLKIICVSFFFAFIFGFLFLFFVLLMKEDSCGRFIPYLLFDVLLCFSSHKGCLSASQPSFIAWQVLSPTPSLIWQVAVRSAPLGLE